MCCYAMLCYVLLCYAMPCYAMLCYAQAATAIHMRVSLLGLIAALSPAAVSPHPTLRSFPPGQDASPRTALVQLVTAEANHELGSAIVKTVVSSPPQTPLSPSLGMPSSTASTKLRMDDAGLAAIAGLVAPKEGTFTSGGLAENPVTTVAASRAQRAPRKC